MSFASTFSITVSDWQVSTYLKLGGIELVANGRYTLPVYEPVACTACTPINVAATYRSNCFKANYGFSLACMRGCSIKVHVGSPCL